MKTYYVFPVEGTETFKLIETETNEECVDMRKDEVIAQGRLDVMMKLAEVLTKEEEKCT